MKFWLRFLATILSLMMHKETKNKREEVYLVWGQGGKMFHIIREINLFRVPKPVWGLQLGRHSSYLLCCGSRRGSTRTGSGIVP
jgi:hypothetical protein